MVYLAIKVFAILCLWSVPAYGNTQKSDILFAISKSMSPFYDKYQGIKSKRQISLKEIDPDNGETLLTKSIERNVWEFLRKDRKSEVSLCVVDGKKVSLDDCDDMGAKEPLYPIFGSGSSKYYRLSLLNTQPSDGKYKVEVIPLEETSRHFKGMLTFSRDYRLTKMEGTIADLPFPLKKFKFALEYMVHNEVDVVKSGNYEVAVKIPLVLDKLIKSTFTATSHELIL